MEKLPISLGDLGHSLFICEMGRSLWHSLTSLKAREKSPEQEVETWSHPWFSPSWALVFPSTQQRERLRWSLRSHKLLNLWNLAHRRCSHHAIRKEWLQILNKTIDLHCRCPKSSRAEEKCRFLKHRVSSNVPRNAYIKVPRDFAKPVASWASLELESAFNTLFKRFWCTFKFENQIYT